MKTQTHPTHDSRLQQIWSFAMSRNTLIWKPCSIKKGARQRILVSTSSVHVRCLRQQSQWLRPLATSAHSTVYVNWNSRFLKDMLVKGHGTVCCDSLNKALANQGQAHLYSDRLFDLSRQGTQYLTTYVAEHKNQPSPFKLVSTPLAHLQVAFYNPP
jgi:hypothetical protein